MTGAYTFNITAAVSGPISFGQRYYYSFQDTQNAPVRTAFAGKSLIAGYYAAFATVQVSANVGAVVVNNQRGEYWAERYFEIPGGFARGYLYSAGQFRVVNAGATIAGAPHSGVTLGVISTYGGMHFLNADNVSGASKIGVVLGSTEAMYLTGRYNYIRNQGYIGINPAAPATVSQLGIVLDGGYIINQASTNTHQAEIAGQVGIYAPGPGHSFQAVYGGPFWTVGGGRRYGYNKYGYRQFLGYGTPATKAIPVGPVTLTNYGLVQGSTAALDLLDPGSTVTNLGTLSGTDVLQQGTLTNSGIVLPTATGSAASSVTVLLRNGGAVYNLRTAQGSKVTTGTIQGAIYATGGALTVTNAGTIAGDTIGGTAAAAGVIVSDSGGTVTNATTGLILGIQQGIHLGRSAYSGETVANAKGSFGSFVAQPATVTNAGTISATNTGGLAEGIVLSTVGTVINSGLITAQASTAIGLLLQNGGSISNAPTSGSSAAIIGQQVGVALYGGLLVRPAGTVTITETTTGTLAAGSIETLTPGATLVGTGSKSSQPHIGTLSQAATSALASVTSTYSATLGTVTAQYGATLTNAGTIAGMTGVLVGGGGANLGTVTRTLKTRSVVTATIGTTASQAWPFPITLVLSPAVAAADLGVATVAANVTAEGPGTITGPATISDTYVYTANATQYRLPALAPTVVNSGTLKGADPAGVNLNAGYGLLSQAGGSFSNTGLITGGNAGVEAGGAPTTIQNLGTISGTGTAGLGVVLTGAGSVTNSGRISGVTDGLYAFQSLTLANSGTLTATATGGVGAALDAGGSLSNSGLIGVPAGGDALALGDGTTTTLSNTGTIRGGAVGILQTGGTLTASGAGTISASDTSGIGIDITPETSTGAISLAVTGGLVQGPADGILASPRATVSLTGSVTASATSGSGVVLLGGGSLSNSGSIAAPNAGVAVFSGGTVTNLAGGVISGSAAGIQVDGGGSVGNAGTVTQTGNGIGIDLSGGGSVGNTGLVRSALYAIEFAGGYGTAAPGATVSNTGTVVGQVGVYAAKAGPVTVSGTALTRSALSSVTVINSGEIAGTTTKNGTVSGYGTAVDLLSGNDTVLVQTGGWFGGAVLGNPSGTNTLAFGAGETATASGLLPTGGSVGVIASGITLNGTAETWDFAGFTNLQALSGAVLGFVGPNTIGASGTFSGAGVLLNTGSLAFGGVVQATGTLGNSGTITGSLPLQASGLLLANLKGGVIQAGVTGTATGITISNAGTLAPNGGISLSGTSALLNGDSLTPNATVSGGVQFATDSYLSNFGTITGGVTFTGGNGTFATPGHPLQRTTVTGNNASLVDAGTIDSATFQGVQAQVTLLPGGTIGTLSSAEGDGSLLLTAGTAVSAVNLSGVTGFPTAIVQSGGNWRLNGTSQATLTVNGVATVAGSIATTPTVTPVGTTNPAALIVTGTVGSGVVLNAGAELLVPAGGTISRPVVASGAATAVIYGAVDVAATTASYAVDMRAAGGVLGVGQNAVFGGKVQGNGSATLDLLGGTSGAAAGQLSGLGAAVGGFSLIDVADTAIWELSGANTLGAGIVLGNAGAVANAGILSGTGTLVTVATFANAGTIALGQVTNYGILLNRGLVSDSVTLGSTGYLYNETAGTISGNVTATGTSVDLVLAGSVKGNIQLASTGGYLALEPGVAIAGSVTSSSTVVSGTTQGNILDLGLGSTAGTSQAVGTLTGLGSQYAGFTGLREETGAAWVLGGNNTLGAGITFANYGALGVTGTLASSGRLTGRVAVGPGGTLLNRSGGVIAGQVIALNGASFANAGTISGTNATLADLIGFNETLTNAASGTITGGAFGVYLAPNSTGGSAGTFVNNGLVRSAYGIYVAGTAGQATVINTGTIIGTGTAGDAVVFEGGNDRLILAPSGSVSGIILANPADADVVELQAGAGTLAGSIVDAATLALDTGANWLLTGRNAVGALAGNGTLTIGTSGALALYYAGSAGGTIIDSGLLDLGAAGATGGMGISLTGAGILRIESGVTLAAPVAGFMPGTTLDFAGIQGGTLTMAGSVLTVSNAATASHVTLSGFTGGAYLAGYADGTGGTQVVVRKTTLAAPDLPPATIALGAFHLGTPPVVSLPLLNNDVAGGGTLVAAFGKVTGPFTGSGSLTLAPTNAGTLTLTAVPTADGPQTGTAVLALSSTQTGASPVALTGDTIAVTGTAYALANPVLPTTLLLASRVGSGTAQQSFTLADGSNADPYREALDYALPAVAGLFDVSSASPFSGTLAAGASATFTVTTANTTAGSFTASLPVTLTSDGAGTSGLGLTSLNTGTVAVTADIYALAQAGSVPASVVLPVVHVGAPATDLVAVSNLGTGGLVDGLTGTITGFSGVISGTAFANAPAGSAGTLDLRLAPVTSGVFSETGTLALSSTDPNLPAVSLGSDTIAVTGTAYNFATLALAQTGGASLTGLGNTYTLNLGSGGGTLAAQLSVLNAATGLADALSGTFSISGSSDFINSGFANFTSLAAGAGDVLPAISISAPGTHTETITIQPIGSDPGGYSGTLAPATLVVTATINVAGLITDEADLNAVIANIDTSGAAGSAYAVSLAPETGTIALTTPLDAIDFPAGASLTILGNGNTIDGQGVQRGFFDLQGNLTLQNLTIANAVATGGAGGNAARAAGGGGAGLGGGLFVAGPNVVGGQTIGTGGTVNLTNVAFIGNGATGGAGGVYQTITLSTLDGYSGYFGSHFGGGGGMGGAGGADAGGGLGLGASGGGYQLPGSSGIVPGATAGGSGIGSGFSGPHLSGQGGGASGGGGGFGGYLGGGGGGGIGGANGYKALFAYGGFGEFGGHGGAGGFGGGGGNNAPGGFGGGGGGNKPGGGGNGGFGGGGGGGYTGNGGYGGGQGGLNGFGGGGAGFGADVFVQQGGSLVINAATLGAGTVAGGAGYQAGEGLGSSVFLQGTAGLAFSPAVGQTTDIDGTVVDQTASTTGAITLAGAGTLRLEAANRFAGGFTIGSGGTLELGQAAAAGSGTITFAGPATLRLDSSVPGNVLAGFSTGDTIDLRGQTVAAALWNGTSLALGLTAGGTIDLAIPGSPSALVLATASDGAGGTDIVAVQAAAPGLLSPASVDLGAVYFGQPVTVPAILRNNAAGGLDYASLDAAISGTSGSASLSLAGDIGTLAALGPQSTGTLAFSLPDTAPGVQTGSATIGLSSDAADLGLTGRSVLPSQTVQATDTVYAYAQPILTGSLNLGSVRSGGTLLGDVILSNGSSAQTYQASLGFAATASGAGLSILSGGTGLLASGQSLAVDVALTTPAAGVLSDPLAFALTSGGSGLPDTVLPGQTMTATGTFYAPAIAQYATTISFGAVHVGDTVSVALPVANTATGALTDVLDGRFASVTGAFSGSGTLAGVAAGSTGTVTIGLNTGTAGVQTGAATLTLDSHDSALSDLLLTAPTVTLTGSVYNYATLALERLSGPGVLTQNGSDYTLNLGAISSATTVDLGILNQVTGLADLLSGSFTIAGSPAFTNTGFAAFSGLGDGQADSAPVIVLGTTAFGSFTETISVLGTGSNASGYSGALPTATLTVTGVVVPAVVANEADLNAELSAISAGGGDAAVNTQYTIELATNGTIDLTSALDQINLMAGSTLTIDGNGATIDGQGTYGGLVDLAGGLVVNDLTIADAVEQGGDGQSGTYYIAGGAGGGGAGLGGGLLLAGSATLNNVVFRADSAVGGNGGALTYGSYNDVRTGAGGGLDGFGAPGQFGGGGGGNGGNGGFGGGGGVRPFAGGSGGFGAGSASLGFSNGAFVGQGGGGLGAGGDIFVETGGSLTINGGTLNNGTVAGGSNGGQGLGSLLFLEGNPSVTLAPPAGTTTELAGSIGDVNGTSTLTIGGSGIVQVEPSASYAGTIVIAGGTLAVPLSAAGLTGRIVDDGALTVTQGASAAVAATVPTTDLLATDQAQLVYWAPNPFGPGWVEDDSYTVPADSLQDLAAGINALPFGFPTATYDAATGGVVIQERSNLTREFLFSLTDATGTPLQKLGLPASTPYTGYMTIAAITGSFLKPTDAIAIDGTVVTVGGTGKLTDLVASIQAAAIAGLTVSIDTAGLLHLSDAVAPLTLADMSGTPLQTLGLEPGIYATPERQTLANPISGTGSVVQSGLGDLVLTGSVSSSGGTVLQQGTVELSGPGSAGSGAIVFQPATTIGPVLKIDGSIMPANTIEGFATGGIIDLSGVAFDPTATTTLLPNNVLQIQADGGTYDVRLDQAAEGQSFGLFADRTGGTEVLAGNNIAPAVAQVGGTLSLGVVHVGDTGLAGLPITNLATGLFNGVLTGSLAAVSGAGFSGSGSLGSGVTVGATGDLPVALATGQAGTFAGVATLALASLLPGGTGTPLDVAPVVLTGTVDNYATAAITVVSGPGTLVNGTIELGVLHVGDPAPVVVLGALNAAAGTADLLSGAFAGNGGGFINNGTVAISGLGAGAVAPGATVTLFTEQSGTFSETLTLAATGSNASGYSGTLAPETVTLVGTVFNPASVGLQTLAGSGNLSESGSVYTLDLGTLWQPGSVDLGVFNQASTPADTLSGSFAAIGSRLFTNSGFASFSGLAAGADDAAPVITIGTSGPAGEVSETITISGTGSSAAGSLMALTPTELVVTAIIPNLTAIATEADLNAAIAGYDGGGPLGGGNGTIDLAAGATIDLTGALNQIDLPTGAGLTIIGNGATIDGLGNQEGFFVQQGSLTLDNLTIANAVARGGNGNPRNGYYSAGGGGGAGLGGGLFVAGSATLNGVSFSGDGAFGGSGGSSQFDYFGDYGPGSGGGLNGFGNPGGFGGGGNGFQNGGFGGGGGAYASGGFGGGNSGRNFQPSGGGGLGAGADIFVKAGGQLALNGGSLGAGTVAGGSGGNSGQGLGSAIFADGATTIDLAPAAGTTETIDGSIAGDNAASALDLTGPGTVQLGGSAAFAGPIEIGSGSLGIAGDPGALTGSIVNDAALVFDHAATGSVVATVPATGLLPGDQIVFADDFVYGTIAADSLQDIAGGINGLDGFYNVASYDPIAGTVTDMSVYGTLDVQFYDASGQPLEALGLTPGEYTGPYDGSLQLGPAAPFLPASDALSINGTTVAVDGSGQLSDLVSAINAAGIRGVAASEDAAGLLHITDTAAALVLADAAGTPLEILGLKAGTYTSTETMTAPVTGTGSLVQDGQTTLLLDGTDTYSGGTTIDAGAVELGDAAAAGSGPIAFAPPLPGTLVVEGTILPANSITGFARGDTIDLANLQVSNPVWNGASVVLSLTGGGMVDLAIAGNAQTLEIVASGDGAGGTDLTAVAPPRSLVWTGAVNTGFANPGNWDNASAGFAPATQGPTEVDSVTFGQTSGGITGSGTVANLMFDDGGAWQMSSGAALTATGSVVVGDTASASLLIDQNATLAAAGTAAVIASTAGAGGSSVNVTGAGSTWRVSGVLMVGDAGFGQLSISQGATVTAGGLDAGVSAQGAIDLSGAGSELTLTGDGTIADAGSGEMSILNGAAVTGTDLTVGSQGTGSGVLTVSDAGSLLQLSGTLYVGTAEGVGELTVGPNATIIATSIQQQGQVVLEGGLLDPNVIVVGVGQTNGGFGTVGDTGGLIDNDGTLLADAGTKSSQKVQTFLGTIVGQGIMQIDAGSTLEVAGPVLSGTPSVDINNDGTPVPVLSSQDVVFSASTGVLKLDDIGAFAGTVGTYFAGDQFIITGGVLSGLGVSGGTVLTVNDSGNGGVDRIAFAAAISAGQFSIVDGNTIDVVQCFAAGTLIQTASGPVAVEALCEGELVVTAEDGRLEPVVWVGRRAVNCAAHPRPEQVWPVRVRKGAFGPQRPVRDLFLSPDHAVFVNDVLVPVKYLVNGTSIAQVQRPSVVYYHIELPQHDLLLAEGLAVESYLDVGDRSNFENGGGAIALFPNFTSLKWETEGCAPLVVCGPELEAARAVVSGQAGKPATYRIALQRHDGRRPHAR
jgi:hypothetical protein